MIKYDKLFIYKFRILKKIKTMKFVGIDFSILHPAITIFDDNIKKYKFITVYNEHKFTNKLIDTFELMNKNINDFDIVVMINDTYTKKDKVDYYVKEQFKMINQINLVGNVIRMLKNYINADDDLFIVMEGFSYGSRGDVLFDIGNITGMIKYLIISNFFPDLVIDNFIIASPMTLKKFYLKGNADKIELFKKFISEDDKYLRDSSFFNFILNNKNESLIRSKKMIKSPWNDIIDSYIAVRYGVNEFNSRMSEI